MNSRSILALLLSISIATSAAPFAFAGDDAASKTEARAHYDKGVKLYNEGAYEAALVEFQRAYELAPSYKIQYNIGLILQQLNDFVGALRAYQRYLSEGKSDVPSARRSEVDKSIAAVKQNVATVNLTVSAAGAEISVDDVAVGTTPLAEPLMVNAGRRKITATKGGRSTAKVITVAGTETIAVELDLGEPPTTTTSNTPLVTTSSSSSTPTDVPPSKTSSGSMVWVGWTITGALAIGAGVTGVLALKSASTLKSEREGAGASRSMLDDQQSKTKRMALVTDVLVGGALVAACISIYFTLKKSPSEHTSASPTGVQLGVGPGSVVLAGAF